jgi:hypothetical protein
MRMVMEKERTILKTPPDVVLPETRPILSKLVLETIRLAAEDV